MKARHDIARVTKSSARHPSLSADRRAVEHFLQQAHEALPCATIAERIGLSAATVSAILQRLRHEGIATNEGVGRSSAWRAKAHTASTATGRRHPTETYNGAELRPFDGRPGAMDAFSLPSRGMKV